MNPFKGRTGSGSRQFAALTRMTRDLLQDRLFDRLCMRKRLIGIVLCVCSLLVCSLGTSARAYTGFTSFSPPITGATDFATDFPTCTDLSSGLQIGPIGVLFDGTNFFATDPCNYTTYRFTAAGGSATAPDLELQNGLTDGLALADGAYYGTSGTGLYQFDPNTLEITRTVATFSSWLLDIAPYPPDPNILAVSSFGALFTVENPASATPTVTLVGGPEDGIAYNQDGTRFYVAAGHVYGFDLTQPGDPVVLDVPPSAWSSDPHEEPDGMAVAQRYVLAGGINVSNNVFVNTWDGNLVRIDTNNGNAVSVVASGGSRGDFVTVGADGCLYATQSDRVEKMSPCFFAPFVAGNNTGAGTNISVVQGSATVTFDNVTTPGTTSVTPINPPVSGPLPPPPANLVPGTYLDVSTTATYSGPITVCFDYVPPGAVSLFHYDNTTGNWVDVTVSNTPQLPAPNNTEGNVCGQVTSLSPFLIAHSMENEVKGLFSAGEIKNGGLETALLSQLAAAASARSRNNCNTAANVFHAFIDLVNAQSGTGIAQSAVPTLNGDAQYEIDHCAGS